MASTDLSSDAWCKYNQASSPFFWVMEPGQYENTYVFGEVGISSAGGSGGSYVRPDVIDISSFLSGRDEMLSKCQPPVPDLDDLEEEPLRNQDSNNAVNLIPQYTREKRSAIDLGAIDYNRWNPGLDNEPQDLRFVIEDMWAQRGGLDTQNYTKLAWNPGSYNYQDPQICKTLLDPQRFCGKYCEDVNGYPGVNPLTGKKVQSQSTMLEKLEQRPSQENEYPFVGPYSQQVRAVGSSTCGDNFFFGSRFDQGYCQDPPNTMLEETALSTQQFPLKVK